VAPGEDEEAQWVARRILEILRDEPRFTFQDVAVLLRNTEVLPAFTADLLLMLLIGLEASSLRRWTLGRQGRPAVDAVVAADRDEAEMKSFRRWVARGAGPVPSAPPPAPPRRGSDAVIGLFPEAERSR